jgi:hypothetical protein
MRRLISLELILLLALLPSCAFAQRRPPDVKPPTETRSPAPAPTPAAAAEVNEIQLDEATALKAAAVDARISAIVANYALLQRQLQDMQQEAQRLLEDKKKLVTEAARRVNLEVKDPNEWAYESKGQRYVRIRRP